MENIVEFKSDLDNFSVEFEVMPLGISTTVKRNKRIKLQEEQILLLDAKVYYKQAGMWIAAETTGKTLEEAYEMIESTTEAFACTVCDIKDSLNNIGEISSAIEEKNPGLISDMLDELNWGE